MSKKHDISRNAFMLNGRFARCGYDWWWHSFTGYDKETGEEKSFFLEFFTCNPELGQEEPVFGQLPENQKKGRKPSYLMVKAGAWGEDGAQLHRFFGWKQAVVSEEVPIHAAAGNCMLTETKTRGSISISAEEAKAHPEWMCDAGSMSWDLSIDKQIAYNVGYGAGKLLRAMKAFEMFWHAEGMKTAYEGTIVYNGREYRVSPEDCYGYADKNWGKDFTSPWVWLSSNHLISRKTGKQLHNSVFDIGGGRPRIGMLALNRKLLSSFVYEGKEYEFNFSKFWTRTKTAFDCRETEDQIIWHVEQSTLFHRMTADFTCRKKDMLLVNYEAPNGTKRHNRLWNGGTGEGTICLYRRLPGKEVLIDEVEAYHIGCEYGEYDC